MKSREEIITDMCYTWRHDYGLNASGSGVLGQLQSGMTFGERQVLWDNMAQIYDNVIAPLLQSVNEKS